MFIRVFQRKAQGTLEYAVLIMIVIVAIISLQVYIKRGVQGRMRSSTDDIGSQFAIGNGASFNRRVQSYSDMMETLTNGQTNSWIAGVKNSQTDENVVLEGHQTDDILTP